MSAILLAVQVFLPLSASAGMTPEEVKAFKGYRTQAEKGDPVAQFGMGECYSSGMGVAEDLVEAVKWYRKAADQGYAQAQSTLGHCYLNGEGVAWDKVEAVKWFRKGADQGDALNQNNLGFCYAEGKGVAKDEVEAYAYLNLKGARESLAIFFLEKGMSPDARLRGQQRTKELQKEIDAKSAAKRAEALKKAGK